MRTVTATAMVRPDHTLVVPVPDDVPAGECQVVVILQETGSGSAPVGVRFRPHPTGPIDPQTTYRREDVYGDDGR
jgi:hypothetical protein